MDRPDKADMFLRHLEPLQGSLEAYCRRLLDNAADMPEVLQSALANAFRDFHRYAEGTNFRAWMFRYVHLEICNRRRKARRDRVQELPADLCVEETWQLTVDEPLAQVLLESPETFLEQCVDSLAESVRALPELQRSVLLLRVLGEFKYREIAEILAIPLGTVMGLLARSRLRLRQDLLRMGEERGLLKRTEKGPL